MRHNWGEQEADEGDKGERVRLGERYRGGGENTQSTAIDGCEKVITPQRCLVISVSVLIKSAG